MERPPTTTQISSNLDAASLRWDYPDQVPRVVNHDSQLTTPSGSHYFIIPFRLFFVNPLQNWRLSFEKLEISKEICSL